MGQPNSVGWPREEVSTIRNKSVTKEQIALAKSVDLMVYLDRYEAGSLKRSAANEWKIDGIPGLVISNGLFNHTTQGYGGKTALDFLVKVRGLEFKEAVRQLAEDIVPTYNQTPITTTKTIQSVPKPLFELPLTEVHNEQVMEYLQGRGIDRTIIQRCIDNGSLYQSMPYQKQLYTLDEHGEKIPAVIEKNGQVRLRKETIKKSCIFVGFDETQRPCYASQREVSLAGSFKGEITGSRKKHGFLLPADDPNSENLAIFESPIDALSHATLSKYLDSKIDTHRLSLGGVFSLALKEYLANNPNIKNLYLCLDNDDIGISAAKRIAEEIAFDESYQHIKVILWPPNQDKDFNEMLVALYPFVPEHGKVKPIHYQSPDIEQNTHSHLVEPLANKPEPSKPTKLPRRSDPSR